MRRLTYFCDGYLTVAVSTSDQRMRLELGYSDLTNSSINRIYRLARRIDRAKFSVQWRGNELTIEELEETEDNA